MDIGKIDVHMLARLRALADVGNVDADKVFAEPSDVGSTHANHNDVQGTSQTVERPYCRNIYHLVFTVSKIFI